MPKRLVFPPWTDRSGRLSLLKVSVFAGLFGPAIWTFYRLMAGFYMAEPAKSVNHELGLWAFRLLLLSLAITPAMQIFRLPRLIIIRRMVGVAAFAYAFSHICAYTAMENFHIGKVISEIFARFYLTIGFAGLLILGVLTATSVDAAVRKMGTRAWLRLHRLVYLATVLALIHYFIQSKLVVTEPTIFAGLFVHNSLAFIDGRLSIRRGFTPAELLQTLTPLPPQTRPQVLTAQPARVVLWREK